MTPEQEAEIVESFTQALEGRFGPLKPAQAISRCAGFISYLRDEHLPWSRIDHLFNRALRGLNCRQLSKGAVSRLYYIAARNEPVGSERRPYFDPRPTKGSPVVPASPALATDLTRPDARPEPQDAGPAVEPVPQPIGPAASANVPTDNSDDGEQASYLERIERRKSAKRRMDQA